jgi:hypothetical protein
VHAGLRHCASPHRALLEMYRVAKKAAIVLEARESLLMRLAVRLGFTNDFELESVTSHGLESGGMRNGPIPNLNYRWLEREVIKVVRAADPAYVESIRFFYGPRLPTLRFDNVDAPFRRLVLKVVAPVVEALVAIFSTQGNEFGFVIFKTGQLREWELRDGRPLVFREKANERGQAYTLDKERKATAKGLKQATEQATDRRIAALSRAPRPRSQASPPRLDDCRARSIGSRRLGPPVLMQKINDRFKEQCFGQLNLRAVGACLHATHAHQISKRPSSEVRTANEQASLATVSD